MLVAFELSMQRRACLAKVGKLWIWTLIEILLEPELVERWGVDREGDFGWCDVTWSVVLPQWTFFGRRLGYKVSARLIQDAIAALDSLESLDSLDSLGSLGSWEGEGEGHRAIGP